MAGRLKDKVAVVTGAAPRGEGVGNGMATAILFAREGAKVVLVNRSAERAEALAKQIKDEGGEASVFAGDVAQLDAAEAMADFAMKKYGRLDILHNNVGIGGPGTPETVTIETWNKVIEANLTTTMLCTKACLPRMKEGGSGSIIMVSSIAGALGLMGSTGAVAYATAKAGLHGFTMSLLPTMRLRTFARTASSSAPCIRRWWRISAPKRAIDARRWCRCRSKVPHGISPMARYTLALR